MNERSTELLDYLEQHKALSPGDFTEIRTRLQEPGSGDLKQILLSYRQISTEELIEAILVVEGHDEWVMPGYRIDEQLGHGAMGTVYRAIREKDSQEVALKLLSDKSLADKSAIERFERELALATKLDTPGLPWYGERGRCRGGNHYYVMQRVQGENLRQRMLRLQGPIEEDLAWKVLYQMSMVLKHINQHGIVHRDIKPDNILIDDELIWLIDLGLAIEPADDTMQLTDDNLVMGTPYYMSPEQARGTRKLTVASDIYSLGATMYHVATRRPPFDGRTALEVMTHHDQTPVEPPHLVRPKLSEEFSRLIVSMMAKHPLDRPKPDLLCDRINKSLQSLNRLDRAPGQVTFEPQPDDSDTRPAVPKRPNSSGLKKRIRRSSSGSRAVASRSAAHQSSSGGPTMMHWLSFAGITIGIALLVLLLVGGHDNNAGETELDGGTTHGTESLAPRTGGETSVGKQQPIPDIKPTKAGPPWPSSFAKLEKGPPVRLTVELTQLKPGKGWRYRTLERDGAHFSPHQPELKTLVLSLPDGLHLRQASGVCFPAKISGAVRVVAQFERRATRLDSLPGLGVRVGSLFLEIGRVSGPKRFHRIAEIQNNRLTTIAQKNLPISYLDRADKLHRVSVVLTGNRITMTVNAGGKTETLNTKLQPRPGPLGAYCTGSNGQIMLRQLLVESQSAKPLD